MAVKACEHLPGARPGNAFARFDQEQCSVGGALDQAGAGIEELIRLPLQRDSPMRAAIFVGIQLSFPAHEEQAHFSAFEAAARTFGQCV